MNRRVTASLALIICALSCLLVAILVTQYTSFFMPVNKNDTLQVSFLVLPSSNITQNQSTNITVKVSCNGTAITNASVSLSCNSTSLNTTSVTDSKGELSIPFASNTTGTFMINASVSKSGYISFSNCTFIVVSPQKEQIIHIPDNRSWTFAICNRSDMTNASPSGCNTCNESKRTIFDDGISSAEGGACSKVPLFNVSGLLLSPYLRTSVGEVYHSGIWAPLPSTGISYEGGLIFVPSLGSEVLTFEVIPIYELGGFIPVSRETCEVEIEYKLTRFPSMMSFYLDGTTSKPYAVTYSPETHDEDLLRSAKCANDPRLLQLSSSVTNRTRELAISIAKGIVGDYQRAIAIRDFLIANYIYDKNYTRAPAGRDPVDWFLFEEKRGVCANFNSAFVILCRCVGIPSRVVRGYMNKVGVPYQTITSCAAHCWAEVEFLDIGWVTFDATGLGSVELEPQEPMERIRTITHITSQPSITTRRDTISISGTVKTIDGVGVSGIKVLIYLAKDKNSTGTIIGTANVTEGTFIVDCIVPSDCDVGDFLLVAKTTGDERYFGSESDPPIAVMCRTSLSINLSDVVSVGELFNITGLLLEDETKLPISNTSLDVAIVSVSLRSIKTDLDGHYRSSVSLASIGNYTISINYRGDKFHLPSQIAANVRVVNIRLDWTAEGDVIRNERWDIDGGVLKGEKGIEDAEVSLVFDGKSVLNSYTDALGVFILNYNVPIETELGSHKVTIALPAYRLSVNKTIRVLARTKLTLAFPSTVEGGKSFSLTASLSDDSGNPIPNQTLTIGVSSISETRQIEGMTDKDGLFSTNLTATQDERVTTMDFAASFLGSGYYIASGESSSIAVLHALSLQPIYLVGAGTGVLITLLGAFLIIRKKFKPIPKLDKQERIVESAQSTSIAPENPPSQNPEISLAFPLIRDDFPLVWGIGDPLDIKVTCRNFIPMGSTLTVTANGQTLISKECDVEQYLMLCFNEKGDHMIEAKILHEDKEFAQSKVNLRIVDYREEVSSMHKAIVSEMQKVKISIDNTLTLREESDRLLSRIPNISKEALGGLYWELEQVDYTLRTMHRDNYERAYLALQAVMSSFSSEKVPSK